MSACRTLPITWWLAAWDSFAVSFQHTCYNKEDLDRKSWNNNSKKKYYKRYAAAKRNYKRPLQIAHQQPNKLRRHMIYRILSTDFASLAKKIKQSYTKTLYTSVKTVTVTTSLNNPNFVKSEAFPPPPQQKKRSPSRQVTCTSKAWRSRSRRLRRSSTARWASAIWVKWMSGFPRKKSGYLR